jgi:hypothetical protein
MEDKNIDRDQKSELASIFGEKGLKVKDKLPTAYIITKAIIDIQRMLSDPSCTNISIRNAILGLKQLIPSSMEDKEYKEELKKCITITIIDIRPSNCETKLSIEYCRKMGYPIRQTIQKVNSLKLFNTIVCLFSRNGMYTKTIAVEQFEDREEVKDQIVTRS